MFDRPQIISPENHPKDCVVFVERAMSAGDFLRTADRLISDGEHRIICWQPPKTAQKGIEGMLTAESGQGVFKLWRSTMHHNFFNCANLHIDSMPHGTHKKLLLNGAICNLTQTLEGQGTPTFFLRKDHPRRKDLYAYLDSNNADESALYLHGVRSDLNGPFSLAAGGVALLLPKSLGSQATLHGFPIQYYREESRKTSISIVELQASR